MLHDLSQDDGYIAMKRKTVDIEEWRQKKVVSKTALLQEK